MRRTAFNKILALVLTASMTLALSGCIRVEINLGRTTAATETEAENQTTSQFSENTTQTGPHPQVSDVTTAETSAGNTQESSSNQSSNSGTASGARPVYETPDISSLNKLCEELTALAGGNDASALLSKYEEVYNAYAHLEDIDNAAYLDYCDNVTDELSDRYEEADALVIEGYDTVMIACHAITEGPCADAFKGYVGDVAFEEFSDYEPMTDEDFARSNRETSLVTDYYDAVARAEENNMSDEDLNKIVGPIYLELVKLRNEEARAAGYDNYADYADEMVYLRDYDGTDAEKLHTAVKAIGSRYYSALYSFYYGDYYSLGNDLSSMNDIINALRTYGQKIDPIIEDSVNYLESNKLYDVTASGNRRAGAYTIEFSDGTPYIFATLDSSNFITLSHEFGHFTAAFVNPNPNLLIYSNGSLDICEIHSNALQGLYSNFYEDIYGRESAAAWTNMLLIDLLGNVVDGCIFDEFQRKVYQNPDITLDELNKLYLDTCKAYGDPYAEGYEYWWQQVHHNFESPMYYFSYAASGFVALQIWAISQSDFDYACDLWRAIIDAGAYDYGYLELLDNLGLNDFTDASTVNEVLGAALDKIESSSGSSNPFGSLFPGGLDDDGKGDDEGSFDIEDYFNDIFGGIFDQFGNFGSGGN